MFINKLGSKCLFVASVTKFKRLQFNYLNRFHLIAALNGIGVFSIMIFVNCVENSVRYALHVTLTFTVP